MTDTATWGSWKSHGNASELYYWGQSRKAAYEKDGRLITLSMEKGLLVGRDAQGNQVLCGGNATRFWASQVKLDGFDAAEYEKHYGTKPASDPKVVAKQAAEDTKSLTVKTCRCGCGTVVPKRSLYRQGHDAKHVAELAKEVRNGSITMQQAIDDLPSDALAVKLTSAVSNGKK
jgi:hypothetical protein